MNFWLLYNPADAEKNMAYIKFYEQACRRRGISFRLILTHELTLITREGNPEVLYEGAPAPLPDFAVCRSRNAMISRHLEQAGVRVFNNSFVTEVCNDKARTYQYLAGKGIPMPDSCFCKKEDYRDCFAYPVVVKSCNGHGGSEVFLVHDREEYERACAEIASHDVVVQKLVSDPGRDLRVYVIGKEIVAAMLRESQNDFRSNYSLGGKASVYKLNEGERRLVERIAAQFEFGLAGIDLMFHNGCPVLNEIEDVVGARMLYQHTDIDLVERYFDFMLKNQNS